MDEFNPDQDPFEGILNQGRQALDPAARYGNMQQMQQMGAQEPGASMPMMVDKQAMMQDVTQPGSNPGTTKYVLSALQSLQKFIAESTDLREIQAVRGVITVLSRIMESDQNKQTEKEAQMGQGQEMGMPEEEQMMQ